MSARWSPFIKQVVAIGTLVLFVWVLLHLRGLLTPLILALLLAYLVSFPIHWIQRNTGWPRTPVVAVTFLVVLVVFSTAPVLIVPRLLALLGTLSTTLLKVIQDLASASPQPIQITPALQLEPGILYQPISDWLKSLIEPVPGTPASSIQGLLFPFASRAAVVVRGAVSSVVWTFFVLGVAFYVAKDAPSMGRWLLVRMPDVIRPEMQRLFRELALIWDAFVRGQITLALVMGVIVWIVTAILGIRSAPALGLVSAIAEFMPGVGPVVAGAIGVLVALILGSSWVPLPHHWFALLVALLYLAMQQIENLYMVPRIVGRRISLHPAVVIVGALAGAEMGGVLGILLAAPVLASARLLFGYVFRKLLDQEAFPPVEVPPDPAVVWPELLHERAACALLFDLDGTLLRLDEDIVGRLTRALSPTLRVFPGANPGRIARRLLLAGNLLVERIMLTLIALRLHDLAQRLEPRLRLARATRGPGQLEAVPGSVEAVRWLAKRYRLAMVTDRPRAETLQFLGQYGLTAAFGSLVTREDVSGLKLHPLPVIMAAKQLGVPPERCVLVGDTAGDVRTARAAGMLSIGVLSGLGGEGDLSAADLVSTSVAQLGAWL